MDFIFVRWHPYYFAVLTDILNVAMTFKNFRMKQSHNKNISSLETLQENQNILFPVPARFKRAQFFEVLKAVTADRGEVVEGMWSVSACVCSMFLRDPNSHPKSQCPLFCFTEHVYEDDLALLNSNDSCYLAFLEAMMAPDNNGAKKMLHRNPFLDISITFLFCFFTVHVMLFE